mgnify:FL=1
MKPVIVDGITKSFKKTRVLEDVTFSVEEGDIFGFLGPNGAGKTTTLLIILGLLEADTGAARVFGSPFGEDARIRRRAGVVLDSHGLYETMTLHENLDFFARLYGVPAPGARAGEAAELAKISDRLDTRVGELSHGLKRRGALARALVTSPDILFLDEPTAGLDPEAQVDFRELLLRLNRERGITVFFNSHNLEEVQKLCRTVGVLDKGRLLLYGGLEELRSDRGPAENRYELSVTRAEDAGKAEGILRSDPGITETVREGMRIRCVADSGSQILKLLVDAEIGIESFNRYADSLEDVYLRIVRAAEGPEGIEGGEE